MSLRERCIEAAVTVLCGGHDPATRYTDDPEEPTLAEVWRNDQAVNVAVNAALAQVAAWCDEQTWPAELDVWVPLHDGKDRELSLGRQIGWVDAFRRMAARCRGGVA